MTTHRDIFDLTGKVALVTGGGTHLGFAMAEALAAHGAKTYIAGRRVDVIEQAASSINEQGSWCRAVPMDITDAIQVEAVIAETGPLDIVVCNAGANAESRYPPDTDLDVLRATLESHLLGTVTTANAAARQMLERGSGSIITISSVHGSLAADPRLYAGVDMSQRSSLAYQTAKAAVIGLTRNLAAEFGRFGVRVNCISPGHIPKPTADPEFVGRVRDGNALGVVGQPEDMKGAVLLLASDAGRFIVGHNLVVDGGWSIW